MAQFESFRSQFEEAAVSVVFIAAEKRTGLFKPEKFFQQHPSSFPFLLDEDRSVTKAWGVYQRLRVDAIRIARPATFILDRKAFVQWIYVGQNQTDRARVEEVLGQAKRLSNS